MKRQLSRLQVDWAQPPAPKFARPLILLPELFTTSSHLSLLSGYLASIGWEVFALNLYSEVKGGRADFADLSASTVEAIAALDCPVVVLGHGLGGLLALAMRGQPTVASSVAIAPAIPGFRSPLLGGWLNRAVAISTGWLRPPAGRVLFEFVADAAPFQREALIKGLVTVNAAAPLEIARGSIKLTRDTAKPSLIIAGEADIFAPHNRAAALADSLGAHLVILQGRGHWLIGGQALERVVNEVQRFLVKALGRDLLLMYSEDSD